MFDLWYEILVRIASDSLLGATVLLSGTAAVMLALLYWTGVGRRRLVAKCALLALLVHLSLLLIVVQMPSGATSTRSSSEAVVPIELLADDEPAEEASLVALERNLAAPQPVEPALAKSDDPLPPILDRQSAIPPKPDLPEVAPQAAEPTPEQRQQLTMANSVPNRLEAAPAQEPTPLAEIVPPSRPTESLDRKDSVDEPTRSSVEPSLDPPPTFTVRKDTEPTPTTSIAIAESVSPRPPSPPTDPPPSHESPSPTPVSRANDRRDGEVIARPAEMSRPSRAIESPSNTALAPPVRVVPSSVPDSTTPVVIAPPTEVAKRISGTSRIPPAAPPRSSTDSDEVRPRFDLEETIVADRPQPIVRRSPSAPASSDAPTVDIASLVARSRAAEPQIDVPPVDHSRFWANRTAPDRLKIVVQHGGSEQTETAVSRALAWLAAHQSDDGRWDSDGFDARCPGGDRCDGPAIETQSDAGLTGLSLLAFLGAGHTHTKESQYQETVRRGLSWLIRIQKPDGDLQLGGRIYSHSMATLALTEAFAMTGDDRLRGPAQRGVLWLAQAQHADSGGWRYGPNQFGDTSVFGWAVLVLRSARSAELDVPAITWNQAQKWIAMVSSGSHGGLASYRPGYPVSHAMTAETLFCRQVFGLQRDSAIVDEAADYVLSRLPDAGDYHVYYWYYGTLAMFQLGGDRWQRWNSRLAETLLSTQRTSGHAAGSWDPKKPFGVDGGRVFATAASAMCLEVYYRYLPLYTDTGKVASPDP